MVSDEDGDREVYLRLLVYHMNRHQAHLTGYCLMGNHVHLLLVPEREDSLAKAVGRTHLDYARWRNIRRGETGHLWQNRYFSCPLDERYRWEALRYVELNPLRAGLVGDATDWRWSSAAAHAGGEDISGFLDAGEWSRTWTVHGWREALEYGIRCADFIERIRASTRTGRPVATTDFVEELERTTKRQLKPQKRGPKAKVMAVENQLTLGV
jgi:putative transposase